MLQASPSAAGTAAEAEGSAASLCVLVPSSSTYRHNLRSAAPAGVSPARCSLSSRSLQPSTASAGVLCSFLLAAETQQHGAVSAPSCSLSSSSLSKLTLCKRHDTASLAVQAHYHDRLDWVETYADKLPQNAFWTVYTKSERGLKGPKRVVQLPNVGREVSPTAQPGGSRPRSSHHKPANL